MHVGVPELAPVLLFFTRNYFPGKRRMRQETRAATCWGGVILCYHIWGRVIFDFLYIEFEGLYFFERVRKYREIPLKTWSLRWISTLM